LFPQSDFTEGVYIDYKGFDQNDITPRCKSYYGLILVKHHQWTTLTSLKDEFGFGLTYTTFAYSDLDISLSPSVSTSCLPPSPENIIQGGIASLWDVVATVTAVVQNTGEVDASEIAQLYIGIPGGPVRQLRGFEKVLIEAGTSVTVIFDLLRRDLSEWDTGAQSWVLQQGQYGVWVGASSRILPLSGTLVIS
jgi:beta-glucosidase